MTLTTILTALILLFFVVWTIKLFLDFSKAKEKNSENKLNSDFTDLELEIDNTWISVKSTLSGTYLLSREEKGKPLHNQYWEFSSADDCYYFFLELINKEDKEARNRFLLRPKKEHLLENITQYGVEKTIDDLTIKGLRTRDAALYLVMNTVAINKKL